MADIRAGIFTASTKAALEDAEQRVAIAQKSLAEAETFRPAFLPRAGEIYGEMVAKLETIEDIPAARESIRELFGGPLRIVTEGHNIFAEAAR